MARLDAQIQAHVSEYQEAITLCTTIPGIEEVAAANLVAEIGVNMDQFGDSRHLASWAGLCPGNHESAGKRKSGRTRKGSAWLRRCLCQAAWAVSTKKNNYLSAQFRRVAARRGVKRATIATAHTLLVIAFHILKAPVEYRDLGGDYFDRLHPETLKHKLVKRLEALGLKVTVEPMAQTA